MVEGNLQTAMAASNITLQTIDQKYFNTLRGTVVWILHKDSCTMYNNMVLTTSNNNVVRQHQLQTNCNIQGRTT